MIEAFSEQLITIDELRARMPHLRAREANLRSQLDALDAQAADRDAYLKLADDLEGFLAQLRGNAATASIEDRQRVLRLLVKDVLIGPEKITIRHRIPARRDGTGSPAAATPAQPTRRVTMRQSYLLCWGRENPACGVPVYVSSRSPSAVMIPALRNALTSASTRLSVILARSRSMRGTCPISSKHALMSGLQDPLVVPRT